MVNEVVLVNSSHSALVWSGVQIDLLVERFWRYKKRATNLVGAIKVNCKNRGCQIDRQGTC
jgi:hypothetical protein